MFLGIESLGVPNQRRKESNLGDKNHEQGKVTAKPSGRQHTVREEGGDKREGVESLADPEVTVCPTTNQTNKQPRLSSPRAEDRNGRGAGAGLLPHDVNAETANGPE